MKSFIQIDNMRFYAYHGVMPQEQKVGNQFSVSVLIEADIELATQNDSLDDTISYADVAEVVSSEMSVPSLLLEHVAGRIYRALMARFQSISSLEVSVYKYNPPGCGETERAGVVLKSH